MQPGAGLLTNRGSPRVTNENSAHVVLARKRYGTTRRRVRFFFSISQRPLPVNEVIRKLSALVWFVAVRSFAISCSCSTRETPQRSGKENALSKEKIVFSNTEKKIKTNNNNKRGGVGVLRPSVLRCCRKNTSHIRRFLTNRSVATAENGAP